MDKLDGPEEQKDTLRDIEPGQSSTVDNQETSKKQAKTYTEQEKEKIINDALAAAGRTAKQLADMEANLRSKEEAIKAREARIAEWERQKEEAELEEAKSDPTKLREYQRKQAEKKQISDIEAQKAELTKLKDEINRTKAEHEAEVKAARDTKMEIKLWQIGAKYGVSYTALKDLNLPSLEQYEAVAKKISNLKPKSVKTGEDESENTKKFTPDSGVTSGLRGTLTPDQFEKLSITEKAKYIYKK